MASNSALATAKRSDTRRRGRQATGGPGVVLIWCVVLCRNSQWMPVGSVTSGNSRRRLSGGVPLAMNFTLGTGGGAVRLGVESEVTQWGRRLFLQSMSSP